jgi:hypothetical protein
MICQTISSPHQLFTSGCLTQLFQAVKRNLRRSKAIRLRIRPRTTRKSRFAANHRKVRRFLDTQQLY